MGFYFQIVGLTVINCGFNADLHDTINDGQWYAFKLLYCQFCSMTTIAIILLISISFRALKKTELYIIKKLNQMVMCDTRKFPTICSMWHYKPPSTPIIILNFIRKSQMLKCLVDFKHF